MALHYKKDGTLDMRYSSSRAEVASSSSMNLSSSSYYSPQPPRQLYSADRSSDLHLKKDGTLDMRYGSSRAQVAASPSMNHSSSSQRTPQPSRQPNSAVNLSDLHLKKDGTLDMRYGSSRAQVAASPSMNHSSSSQRTPQPPRQPNSADMSSNIHLKKDGTLDMRYTSSKLAASAAGNRSVPKDVPLTRDGIPDMRFKDAKEWVKNEAEMYSGSFPSWIPRKKDGNPDYSKAITREFMKHRPVIREEIDDEEVYENRARRDYYAEKMNDEDFCTMVREAREEDVENPEYIILSDTEVLRDELADVLSTLKQSLQSQKRYGAVVDEEYEEDDVQGTIQQINFDEIQFDPNYSLGQGSFGIVYKALWQGDIVAAKVLHLDKLTKKERNSFINEIGIMGSLGAHPNLVKMLAYSIDKPCIVMEYIELGSLHELLHYNENNKIQAKITDGRIKKRIMIGVVLGMINIHKMNIVHGDLKPQNILITDDYNAKITDFGLASLRGKTSTSTASKNTPDSENYIVGTAGYMAPELLEMSTTPELSCDVYSFGIMLNEVIIEEEPYSEQYRNFAPRGPYAAVQYAAKGGRPKIYIDTPVSLKRLIERCWNAHPSSRPSFEQIYKELERDTCTIPNLL